jgi:hypothetical protein
MTITIQFEPDVWVPRWTNIECYRVKSGGDKGDALGRGNTQVSFSQLRYSCRSLSQM